MKAEEKQSTLDEIETKDDWPLEILFHSGDNTMTASVWIQKQEGGEPAQRRVGLIPWKQNEYLQTLLSWTLTVASMSEQSSLFP